MNSPTVNKSDLNRNLFREIAENIEITGYKKTYKKENDHMVEFVGVNDKFKRFIIISDSYRGKLTVNEMIRNEKREYVEFRDDKYEKVGVAVSCSLSKSLDKIIKDIENRFLPDFERVYPFVKERMEKHTNAENNKLESLKEICKVIDMKELPSDHYNKENIRYQFTPYESNSIAQICVSSANSIEIKTNYLTRQQALKVVEFMEKSFGKRDS